MSFEALRGLLGGERLQIADVGVRGGVHPRWTRFGDLVEIVGFDADAVEATRLTAEARTLPQRARYLPYALAATEGEAVFHVCRSPGCSSLYRPNKDFIRDFPYGEYMEVVHEIPIRTATLDRVGEEHGLAPDHLKIDAQGAELDILQAGRRTLAGLKTLELEVAFNELYENQPLFAEIDLFLRGYGFRLLALRRSYWRRTSGVSHHPTSLGGQLVHGDALYYNDQQLADTGDSRELVKWLMLLGAYRQNSLCLHLLHEHAVGRNLDASTRERLTAEVIQRRPLPWRLLGRLIGRIDHTRLRRFTDSLRAPRAVDWHDPEFF